jgi:biopolymer transport protein ExbD
MGRNRLKIGKMNLTSLMDVFTILVFFLLVNSGSVEILDAPKEVTLPEALVEDIVSGEQGAVDPIHARLAELKENIIGASTLTVAASREVTILADKSVPFMVVKTVMSTCTSQGYENVSLAVTQKSAQVAAL